MRMKFMSSVSAGHLSGDVQSRDEEMPGPEE